MIAKRKSEKQGVLCGTDLSIYAAEAANVAAVLAKGFDEKLTLIHVDEFGELGTAHPEAFKFARSKTRELLAQEARRLQLRGARVEADILMGSADEALSKAAIATNSRCVVVAAAGHFAFGPTGVGNVAAQVAETSLVPTLVVRKSAPFPAWVGGQRPLKVLIGCDFSASADAALHWVRGLQEIAPCDIIVTHVDWPPEELRRLGLRGPVAMVENLPEVEQSLERDLKTKTAAIFGRQPISFSILPGWGRPDMYLIQAAQREQADLVVVGTHRRHGLSRCYLGTVSRGVLRGAPMNIAVVPAPQTTVPGSAVPDVRRVLVTTDFSVLGNHAVPYAYAALSRGGSVKLIHLVPPWELPSPLIARYERGRRTPKRQKQLTADSLKKLRALIPLEAASRGIVTETEVVENSDVATGICQAAERFGADLICLGSHGRSGLSKALLGSVAQKVMARSSRPLLVVRPPPP